MEIFAYLPTFSQLIGQVNADIGNTQLYWIIAFASAMLLFHGMYIMLVVISFHKLVGWLSNKRHMSKDFSTHFDWLQLFLILYLLFWSLLDILPILSSGLMP
jgi:uncharacterized membrane protein